MTDECPICFEVITNVNSVVTECGHKFHCKCLMMNTSKNGFACPCCRSNMAINKDDNINYNEITDDDFEDEDDYATRRRSNITRQTTTMWNDNDTTELEEGEIRLSDFDNFVSKQYREGLRKNIPYILDTFRLFYQRIEQEQVQEEEEEDIYTYDEKLVIQECETRETDSYKYKDTLNRCLQSLIKKGITQEDMVASMLYGSFNHNNYIEDYYKVRGKLFSTLRTIRYEDQDQEQEQFQNQFQEIIRSYDVRSIVRAING